MSHVVPLGREPPGHCSLRSAQSRVQVSGLILSRETVKMEMSLKALPGRPYIRKVTWAGVLTGMLEGILTGSA